MCPERDLLGAVLEIKGQCRPPLLPVVCWDPHSGSRLRLLILSSCTLHFQGCDSDPQFSTHHRFATAGRWYAPVLLLFFAFMPETPEEWHGTLAEAKPCTQKKRSAIGCVMSDAARQHVIQGIHQKWEHRLLGLL